MNGLQSMMKQFGGAGGMANMSKMFGGMGGQPP
jgi:hypothetical protein